MIAGLCQICGKPARFTCPMCGMPVCEEHYSAKGCSSCLSGKR